MSRTPRLVDAARLALLLAPLALSGCSRTDANVPPAAAPLPVRVAPVHTESTAPPVRGTGILAPKDEVALSFKIGGIVDRVLVDESARVQKGDTLAALNLREIDAGVTRAKSAAEKAERDLARARRLYADSVATLEQVQDAETGAEVARAALEAASFDRRYAVITAPADGIILRRNAEPGELLSSGTTVLTLGSSARGSVVRVGLADRDVVRVRPGDPATVRFDLAPMRTVEGVVSEIAAAADPRTGTFRVEIRVPEAERLASGLVGDVEIRPASDGPLPMIPVDALLEADGAHATIFAVAAGGGRAQRRDVTIAFLAGDRAAVSHGLDGVSQVVTDGTLRLDDGDSVKVLP
ncbi:MAG: efflux RND transporter periplasmic adaptor subunit [bacterium]